MSNYWAKRQEQLKKALAKDEERLRKRLSSFYDTESKRLEKEIASYYSQYGENNVLEYRKMMESLSDSDRVLLFEKYEKFAKQYPEYAYLMPVRESIYKLDRLQGLQYSVQLQQLNLGAKEIEITKDHLTKNGLRALAASQEAIGAGTSFLAMNENIVKQFVDVPWANNQKFSDTIWKNKEKLTNYLNTDLAQGFARGDSYDRIVKRITERFEKVSKNDAFRLVYTEGTFVMNEAAMQPFTSDFEYYKIATVEDNKVCPICVAMQRESEALVAIDEPFEISNRTPGENFPPFHPWCRCSFEIVVEDWDQWMDDYVAKHGGDRKQAEKIQEKLGEPSMIHSPEELIKQAENDSELIRLSAEGKKAYKNILSEIDANKIEYNKVKKLKQALSEDEIIARVGGGDKTVGSCVSLCHAYVGNKAGWDVLDFRGAGSQVAFSNKHTLLNLCEIDNVTSYIVEKSNDLVAVKELVTHVEAGKEYILSAGAHAAIIRKKAGQEALEYLELQTENSNGFKSLNMSVLKDRFGCKKTRSVAGYQLKSKSVLIDIDTLYNNKKCKGKYKKLLGYLNTSSDDQLKGIGGYAK